jgi:hydroxypyruvate isomerase
VLGLAANVTLLFAELPFPQRWAAAAAAGFRAVECQYPYAHDHGELADARAAAGVAHVLLNAPAGPPELGGWGLAALPGHEAEVRAGLELAARYAGALGCGRVHVLAGAGPTDDATYVANLRVAVDVLGERGIEVVVEPLNHADVPGYHLTDPAHAAEVLAAVPGLRLQCDLYHLARSGHDALAVLRAFGERVGHVQVAGVPARHEPDPSVVHAVGAAGWDGWVGAEYRPAAGTLEGLGWAEPWLRRSPARRSAG